MFLMSLYISNNTLLESVENLKSLEFDNASILHIFFILKACGYNKLEPKPVSLIKSVGIEPAFLLSSLYAPNEKLPDKYDFINPFKMHSWSSQPSEPLRKWVSSRVENNVAGGAKTWRRIVDYDPDEGTIKFTYNYLQNLIDLTVESQIIDLQPFVVWLNRFTKFESPPSRVELIRNASAMLKLSSEEHSSLFGNKTELNISFSDSMCDMAKVRSLLKPDDAGSEWLEVEKITEIKEYTMDQQTNIATNNVGIEAVESALRKFKNVILSGAPATSKSYYAKCIAENFDNVVSLQFHPDYSYQDFIGGYLVEGESVQFNQGALLELCQAAKAAPDQSFLMIIDEINRGNLSAIFGETIQCLDRNYSTRLSISGQKIDFEIPQNLFLLATRNTTDKSLANIDLAIYRRFIDFYLKPDPDVLTDLVELESGISARDLLYKINSKLTEVMSDSDLQIGHALFLNDNVKNEQGKFVWSNQDFYTLFMYSISPLVLEYCYSSKEKFNQVLPKSISEADSFESLNRGLSDYLAIS